jgi:hypothetical protein
MCRVSIKNWYGRFGNNLFQIANACHFAFYEKNAKLVEFPNHFNLRANFIENKNNNCCTCDNYILKENNEFFFDFDYVSLYDKRKILLNNVLNILNSNIIQNVEKIEYENVIHIRSGDVANETNWKNYRKKSFKFYKNVIEHFLSQNKDVLIVYEDNKIEEFNLIYEEYKGSKVVFQSSFLEKDLNSIIRNKSFVQSRGTFGILGYCLSYTNQHLFISERDVDLWNFGSDPNTTIFLIKED